MLRSARWCSSDHKFFQCHKYLLQVVARNDIAEHRKPFTTPEVVIDCRQGIMFVHVWSVFLYSRMLPLYLHCFLLLMVSQAELATEMFLGVDLRTV